MPARSSSRIIADGGIRIPQGAALDKTLVSDASGNTSWGNRLAAFRFAHTWAVGGEIKVPSGDTDFIPGMYVPEMAGTAVKIVAIRHKINSGTSVTYSMNQNGSAVAGLTGIQATTTAATVDPSDVAVADLDELRPVVSAVVGTPKNLTISLILEITAA